MEAEKNHPAGLVLAFPSPLRRTTLAGENRGNIMPRGDRKKERLAFAGILKSLKMLTKVSYIAISRYVGVSDAAIRAYKRGAQFPKVDHLITLSELFDVSTEELLGRSPLSEKIDPVAVRERIKNIAPQKIKKQA